MRLSNWTSVRVWRVGTARCGRSSSLSCRLQCLPLSFFTPPPWKESGMCVCLCEKHTWQRGRPITPPLHQPTSTSPLHPTSSFSALHPTFFPSRASFPGAPGAEMDLCLGLVMSLLATWGLRVQRSVLEELSHFVYSACRRWYLHVNAEAVSVYRSGIVYNLWSCLFIICFVDKFM